MNTSEVRANFLRLGHRAALAGYAVGLVTEFACKFRVVGGLGRHLDERASDSRSLELVQWPGTRPWVADHVGPDQPMLPALSSHFWFRGRRQYLSMERRTTRHVDVYIVAMFLGEEVCWWSHQVNNATSLGCKAIIVSLLCNEQTIWILVLIWLSKLTAEKIDDKLINLMLMTNVV